MESPNTSSPLTLPDEQNMSESCTQTDSLSLPLTVDLGTQTAETDSLDQNEDATGSLVIDATDSVETPSRQMNSGTRDALIPEKYIFTAEGTITEDNTNTDHDLDRYRNLVKDNTLPDECLPGKSSSGEELKWSLYVPRKQDDLKLERRDDEESGDKALVRLGIADEIKCGGRHSARRQESLEKRSTGRSTPLTTNAYRIQPCEEHLVRPSLTCDRRSNVADDVVDGTFNHEMVLAGKNELPHNITDIGSDDGLTKGLLQLQDHHSSSAYTKSSFQGGKVVPEYSPKHPDYEAAKASFASATLPRAAHEIKYSYEGLLENQYTGVERCGGLKDGQKDQCSNTWDRRDTLDLDSASSHKSAKPKEKGQLYSDFPSNTMRVDKGFLSGRVGESDFSGIRPFFLARHTDDTSMSMTSDTWTEKNNEDTPSDIPSRYQRFGCHPDRYYHSRSTCPPSVLPPKGTECYTGPQVLPPPILETDPVMARSLALTNGNEQQPQTYNFDNEPANSGWNNCSGIYPSNSNVSIRNLPPPPLPSPPCSESEYHVLSNDDLSNAEFQSKAPQAVSTASNTLFAKTTSSRWQMIATTRTENTELGLVNNVITQKEIGHTGSSGNLTSTFQNEIRSQAEHTSASKASKKKQQEPELVERETATPTVLTYDESSTLYPVLHNNNSHISDDESLAALERRVAEACSLVERVLKEREEKEKAKKRRELQEQERRERETRESMQRNDNGEGTSTGSEEGAPSERAALPESPQWLCEHYQRLCSVKFPCCGRFYSCHRCHNNSDECQNKNCNAKEAFYIECSVCTHQQAINRDTHTCARCNTRFSAYFCSICKLFTGEDKHPYHCTKCGICRIHKDRSFHCDVCNVCLDKRLQGKHKCRPDSGHDECCVCLEDSFSGCQILPCSHKVHRECGIAMIQNGVRSCPICRHPLYSQSAGTDDAITTG